MNRQKNNIFIKFRFFRKSNLIISNANKLLINCYLYENRKKCRIKFFPIEKIIEHR